MVETEALEKNHTEAFSQVAPARDPKNISPPESEASFPSSARVGHSVLLAHGWTGILLALGNVMLTTGSQQTM